MVQRRHQIGAGCKVVHAVARAAKRLPGKELAPIGSHAPSTHSCIDPSNGQSPLVYREAIVEMPDQAPRTT